MNREEKYMVRIIFKKHIHEADGNGFEEIFTKIMSYKETDFQQVRPWGNIGDRKNDGYIPSQGKYFQVYAPQDPENRHYEAIKKSRKDFQKLIAQWDNVKIYCFVFNDKYRGHHPDLPKELKIIKENYDLDEAQVWTAKDLENILYQLQDDQVFEIIGCVPSPERIASFDVKFEILDEIIKSIMKYTSSKKENISAPDWERKIEYNSLEGTMTEKLLETGAMFIDEVDEYLNNNSEFTSEEIRNKLNQIYLDKKEEGFNGVDLFDAIVTEILPHGLPKYFQSIYAIMAKYFSTCDIFEDPKGS